MQIDANTSLDLWPFTERDVRASDTALLVIDSQYAYCRPLRSRNAIDHEGVEMALDCIDLVRDYADAAGIPTFLVYSSPAHKPDAVSTPFEDNGAGLYRQRFTGAFELAAKSEASAFQNRSQLPGLLKHEYPNVKNLLLTGFNTSACVFKTGRDALERNFNVSVLSDCTVNCESIYRHIEGPALETLYRQGAWVGSFQQYYLRQRVLSYV